MNSEERGLADIELAIEALNEQVGVVVPRGAAVRIDLRE